MKRVLVRLGRPDEDDARRSITRLRVRPGGALGVVSINESGHHARPPAPLRPPPVAQPAAAERTGP